MQIKKREADKIFSKLKVKEKNSKHHISGWIEIDGIKTLPVHYSHGDGDMPANIGDRFRKSFKLNADEFSVLKSCVMTREEYIELIRPRV